MHVPRDLALPALAVTVAAWASAFVAIHALGDMFSPGALTLGRLVVGAATLTVIARPWRLRRPRGRHLALTVVYGAVWFGVYNVSLNAAERVVDAGTASLIVNLAPVIVAVLAGVLLREGLPAPLLAGVAVAFVGVALIGANVTDPPASEPTNVAGLGWCAVAALAFAVGVLAQKATHNHVTATQSVWWGCVIGAVVCAPFSSQLVQEVRTAGVTDLVWLIYLGLVPTAIGFVTWTYATTQLSAGSAASTTYLVPPVVILLAWMVLDETPAPLAVLGGALCLAGVALTRRTPHRRSGAADDRDPRVPGDDAGASSDGPPARHRAASGPAPRRPPSVCDKRGPQP